MKITKIRCLTAGDIRNFLFVVIETDEGISGIGEAGITWREGATQGFVQALEPTLIGQDPMRTEHLWQTAYRGGFFPGGRIGAAALSAIDIALWDIKGKALGVPVYQLLGGRVRDKVVCYTHLRSDAGLVQDAKAKVAAGWRFLRFDLPGVGPLFEPSAAVRRGIEQMAAVRQAVGPEIELIVDVHTRLDPADAVTYCRGVEAFHPFFIEDPVRSENAEGLARVRAATAVPLAMGEHHATKWEFIPLIERKLIDYCRVDVCVVGGLTEAQKVASWCEVHYIHCAPHNPIGPVATAATLHLSLATSNFAVQELPFPPGTYLSELFPTQMPFDSGYLLPPTKPGLGIEINESALARYPMRPDPDPRMVRADGTFTNW